MKLSERILSRRTDRLDEWSMDELAMDAARIERMLEFLQSHAELNEVDERLYDKLCNGLKVKGKAELLNI
jgi:hypothetical protein